MRITSAIAIVCLLSPTLLADDAATFVVKDGAAPWSDRVGTWELGDVPDSLKNNNPIPQQLCSSRELTIAGKPKLITLGVSQADEAAFKVKYSDAKETGDHFTIRHPKDSDGLTYDVLTLPSPPDTISGGDTAFGAGLVLLKIEPGSPPATMPTTQAQ